MNKRHLLAWLIAIHPFFLSAVKPQFWPTILQPIGKIKDIEFEFRQQYRLEMDNFKTVDARFSIESNKKLSKTWEAGVNFTYINVRRPDENPFRQRFRWEFELNPHFKLSKNIELKLRNRYEFIKDEYIAQWHQVFRQRQQLVMKVNYKSLKSISIHNEAFYSVTEERWDQDRLVPLELKFDIGNDHTYILYFMIRWLRPGNSWDPQFVLGSTLDW